MSLVILSIIIFCFRSFMSLFLFICAADLVVVDRFLCTLGLCPQLKYGLSERIRPMRKDSLQSVFSSLLPGTLGILWSEPNFNTKLSGWTFPDDGGELKPLTHTWYRLELRNSHRIFSFPFLTQAKRQASSLGSPIIKGGFFFLPRACIFEGTGFAAGSHPTSRLKLIQGFILCLCTGVKIQC